MTDLRKIDALVAEHVLGHFVWEINEPFADRSGFAQTYTWMAENKVDDRIHAKVYKYKLRRYSADMSAAWEVVAALVAAGYSFDLIHIPVSNSEYSKPWSCSIGSGGTFVGDTAPLAICLAALRTRGIDVMQDSITI